MRLKQRLLVLSEGADIVTFIEHDGKPPDTGLRGALADQVRQAWEPPSPPIQSRGSSQKRTPNLRHARFNLANVSRQRRPSSLGAPPLIFRLFT